MEPMSEPIFPAAGQTERAAGPHPKVFYGWWIVLGCTAILFVSSGIGFYGHGVILDPLRERYGWSKGVISSAVTLYFFTAGVIGLLMGRFIDGYGPRPVLILGSATMGIGFLLLSRVTRLWQLYAVYLLLAVGWSGTSLIPVGTLIANWSQLIGHGGGLVCPAAASPLHLRDGSFGWPVEPRSRLRRNSFEP